MWERERERHREREQKQKCNCEINFSSKFLSLLLIRRIMREHIYILKKRGWGRWKVREEDAIHVGNWINCKNTSYQYPKQILYIYIYIYIFKHTPLCQKKKHQKLKVRRMLYTFYFDFMCSKSGGKKKDFQTSFLIVMYLIMVPIFFFF